MTLRKRLLLGVGAVALILVFVSVAVAITTRANLVEQIDERLTSVANAERARVAGSSPGAENPEHETRRLEPPAPEHDDRVSEMFEATIDEQGELSVIFASNETGREFSNPLIDIESARSATHKPLTVEAESGDVRYRIAASPRTDGYEVWALPLDKVGEATQRLLIFELLGLAAALSGLVAVAWWVIRLGIAPIKNITHAAAEIAHAGSPDSREPQSLRARVPTPLQRGTESYELAAAVNSMLDRIEAATEAQQRSETKLRRFVADASHELRTPITTIRGYSELYQLGGLASSRQLDDAMARTRSEAERMGRLVDELTLLAKFDQRRPLRFERLAVLPLIRQVISDFQLSNPGRSIRLATTPDEAVDAETSAAENRSTEHVSVPAISQVVAQPGPHVLADVDLFRQLLINLVSNAVTHTPIQSDVSIDLRVEATLDETTPGAALMVLTVSDQGPGMPPDVLQGATDRFFRGDPARARDRGGSGLGLAIADEIVRSIHGELLLTSDPHTGTTASVRLLLDTGQSSILDSQPAGSSADADDSRPAKAPANSQGTHSSASQRS